MFGDWFIVLSSSNQLLEIYYNQDIAKEPEADDKVVPVILVDESDGTIYCIDNFFRAGALAKPERIVQTWKNHHEKVRKEKAYAHDEHDQ